MVNAAEAKEFTVLSKVRTGLKREFEFAIKAQSEICGSLGRTRSKRVLSEAMNNDGSNVNSTNKRRKSSGLKKVTSINVVEEKRNDFDEDLKNRVDGLSEEEAHSDIVDVDEEKKQKIQKNGGEFGAEVKNESSVDEEGLTPPVVTVSSDDSGKLENVANEESPSPLRRFTRSALKPEVEPTTNVVTITNKVVGDMKCTKNVSRKFPENVKVLFESGILEGLSVKYTRGCHGKKVKGQREAELKGVIKGCGILCFCSACEGNKVVTPTTYELHAGSLKRHPLENIYLESGKTLRDVMNACMETPLTMLDEALGLVIGHSSMKKSAFCLNCRGSMSGSRRSMLVCNSCIKQKESDDRLSNPVTLPKTVGRPLSSSSSTVKNQGKITRKDLRLHKLVFEEDVLPDGTEVSYYAHGQQLLVGHKKGFAIWCPCCKDAISASQFEAHAGYASRRKPFHNIFTSNGVSLHELALSLSKIDKFSTFNNDELCNICRDGGDLLCCDTCPRVYHLDCVSLPSIPDDKWSCDFCQNEFQKDKSLRQSANAIAAGRVEGVDPIEQITKRLIRIVETSDYEVGGCTLCRGHGFSKSGFGPRTVMICDQCEKEFHVGCLKEHNMADLKELPPGKWFCCTDCDAIHATLEKLINDGEQELRSDDGDDVSWRVVSWRIRSDDVAKDLLTKAVDIFHGQFAPINNSDSGKACDLTRSMVFGKKTKEHDFGGMYCAMLTVNLVVVSTGIFRIFGRDFAELPLVATLDKFQGKGYFKDLFRCMENLLSSVGVKTLMLPAADQAASIWTDKFGFEKMPSDEVFRLRRDYPIMGFLGTSVLQKSVPECKVESS